MLSLVWCILTKGGGGGGVEEASLVFGDAVVVCSGGWNVKGSVEAVVWWYRGGRGSVVVGGERNVR